MALDSRYIIASDLQSLFRDKTTGEPLSFGSVYFYRDANHNQLKPVFKITGSATNPTYTEIQNPMLLSSVGTASDGFNNDIIVYYYPYDDDGNIDLYYVRVFDQNGVVQFDRVAWPNFTGEDVAEVDQINFVPNGQFLAHNDEYITETVNGLDVSPIAQGGWSMDVTTGLGGIYTSTFQQVAPGSSPFRDFPRFKLNFVCTSYGLENVRDIRLKWRDVNSFESAPSGTNLGDQTYTLFFYGAAASSTVLEVRRIKYFGTNADGSAVSSPQDTLLGTVTLTNITDYFNFQLTFGSNAGSVVGDQGDDYVQIALRVSSSSPTFNINLTDFGLFAGNLSLSNFPTMTNAQMLSNGVAGWMPTPNPDGSDLYLPLVLTPQGMTFDHSIVGQIVGKTQTNANAVNNELLMNGSTYVYDDYSALGIPYSRLGDYLIANSPAITIGTSTIPAATIPLYGTGANFVTILKNTDPTKFDLSFNTSSGSNTVNDQTSGFTHTSADPLYVFTVTGVPTAGTYFTFTPNTGGGLVYNVWFTVNGSGTAPATPTGANIPVAIVTGDTVATTITKILTAINQYQFMILDARGYFWRGLDTGTSVDPDSATRTIPGIKDNSVAATGANLGSLESAAFLTHTHTVTTTDANNLALVKSTFYIMNDIDGTSTHTLTSSAPNQGAGNETRPINLALNWYIKY